MPRYIIHPGFVLSKTDGDFHYVGYQQLVTLCKVDPRDCGLYSPVNFYPADSRYEACILGGMVTTV